MTRRHVIAVIRSIAANVRALRLDQGLTQQALAERANLEKSFLQKVERGRSNLSIETLVILADALRVAPERLLVPAQMQHRAVGRPPRPRGESS